MITSLSFASDINITLSERAINSFTTAATPWKFKKEMKILDQKTMAEYTIKDVIIHLRKDKINVEGKLNLEMNGSTLMAKLKGELKPYLNKKTGELELKLEKVDVVGLEFLKLEKVLKDQISIPIKVTNLEPIKLKYDEESYREILVMIKNENITIEDKKIKIVGDLSFKRGDLKKY